MCTPASPLPNGNVPWYQEVTRYQWLVLVIASLGWVFDVFEGQIFVASMQEVAPALLGQQSTTGEQDLFKNLTFAAFLLGGAVGGVGFGLLSDRIGRTRTMIFTILMYSAFTCVSAFAQTAWQMIGLRFLVAMGVGGEWAVASAMVAEVFPKRARARSLGIFHASSVLGTYLAVLAGAFIVGRKSFDFAGWSIEGWRGAFVLGALPAILVLWIRLSLREPAGWQAARDTASADTQRKLGNIFELFHGPLLRHTIVGVGLAAVGLATFWGAHIYGKNLLLNHAERVSLADAMQKLTTQRLDTVFNAVDRQLQEHEPDTAKQQEQIALAARFRGLLEEKRNFTQASQALRSAASAEDEQKLANTVISRAKAEILNPYGVKNWEMLGMLLTTTGGGLGLISFGPLSERLGRRGAFLFFHLGGLASALVLFQLLASQDAAVLCVALPVFGFLTLGMHAGYAIYFPELFPTRLRGTGGGLSFNGGRILAAPILFLGGWMRFDWGFSLEDTASLLSLLFLLGALLLLIAPETRGADLPE